MAAMSVIVPARGEAVLLLWKAKSWSVLVLRSIPHADPSRASLTEIVPEVAAPVLLSILTCVPADMAEVAVHWRQPSDTPPAKEAQPLLKFPWKPGPTQPRSVKFMIVPELISFSSRKAKLSSA